MSDFERTRSPWRGPRTLVLLAGALAGVGLVAALLAIDDDGDDGQLAIEQDQPPGEQDASGDDAERDEPGEAEEPDGLGPGDEAEGEPLEGPPALSDQRALAGGAWEPLADSPLQPRFGAFSAWTGEELVVAGGDLGVEPTASAGAYDPEADAWRELPSAPAAIRPPEHQAAWTGEELIVWGGDPGDEVGLAFDAQQESWRELPEAPLEGRRYHTVAHLGDEVVVWGGRQGGQPVADGAAYDPAEDAWRTIAAPSDVEGMGVTTAATGEDCEGPRCGQLLVWTAPADEPEEDATAAEGAEAVAEGAEAVAAATALSQPPDQPQDEDEAIAWAGAAYDPDADRWEPLADLPRRSGTGTPSLTWGEDRALLCCDFAGGATLGEYDPDSDEWRGTGAAPVGRRTLHAAEWGEGELLIWGGRIRDRWIRGSGGVYDVDDASWASLPLAAPGQARIHPTSAWTGDELLIWGGYDGRDSFADGVRWAPPED